MAKAIVPMTALILLFAGFVIWRVGESRARKRREAYEREREREQWSDDVLRGDRP